MIQKVKEESIKEIFGDVKKTKRKKRGSLFIVKNIIAKFSV